MKSKHPALQKAITALVGVASGFSRKAAAVGQVRPLHASFRLKPEATLPCENHDLHMAGDNK